MTVSAQGIIDRPCACRLLLILCLPVRGGLFVVSHAPSNDTADAGRRWEYGAHPASRNAGRPCAHRQRGFRVWRWQRVRGGCGSARLGQSRPRHHGALGKHQLPPLFRLLVRRRHHPGHLAYAPARHRRPRLRRPRDDAGSHLLRPFHDEQRRVREQIRQVDRVRSPGPICGHAEQRQHPGGVDLDATRLRITASLIRQGRPPRTSSSISTTASQKATLRTKL